MENDIETRKSKDRSPRFPFISLEKSLERASQFYAEEKRGAAPFAAAANHWGYSPNSSGALQTFAALKSYGLLEGTHKHVKLTDLALRILLDKRPDSTERDILKRKAALTPSIAAEINENSPDSLPSDATLNHYLVLGLGFNESTAAKAVNIIKQNQSFISSGLSSVIDVQSPNDEKYENSDIMKDTKDIFSIAPPAKSAPPAATKVWIERTNDPNGLNIVLQIEGEPTEDTYGYLKDFVEFKLGQIKKAKGTS